VPDRGGRDAAGIVEGAGGGEIGAVFLLGADDIDTAGLGEALVVYIGHHGDRGAHRADVILPGAAYTEKSATWVNTEGRPQRSVRAVFPPGEAREDWAIVRALSGVLGHTLPFDTIADLRSALERAVPHFAHVDRVIPAPWGRFGRGGAMNDQPFASPIANYYMTDPISRASLTMARCTAELGSRREATGTHG
jgi:NADH-quinone oxidoreductase subunit G